MEVLLLVALSDGDVVRDIPFPLMLNVCIVPVMLGTVLEPVFMLLVFAADFLSVWRLF